MRVIAGTKFQLKLKILIFFYQICPKREFPVENEKIALVCASMVVTYYIKLVRAGSDRHNCIVMSLLLLVTETIRILSPHLVLPCLDINLLVKHVLFFRENMFLGEHDIPHRRNNTARPPAKF